MNKVILSNVLTALIAFATSTSADAETSNSHLRKMEGALLKGDGAVALDIANRAQKSELLKGDRDYATCVEHRLKDKPGVNASLDPLTAKIIYLYESYWRNSLVHSDTALQDESVLARSLEAALGMPNGKSFESIESEISKQLAGEGYFVLTGTTPPLHELMLWKRQTARNFDVALPDDKYTSHVILLDGFASSGWAAWATCSQRATGGWATGTTLYAPMPRYKEGTSGNNFKAVFLTHETQHFADKNRFAGLKPWELEYRAKLAELWAADKSVSKKRLQTFVDSQSEDENLAHPYANRKVIADLKAFLSRDPATVELDDLHAAAEALLKRDSASRLGNGGLR